MSFKKDTDWFIVCDSCGCERGPYKSEEEPPDISIPGWLEWETSHACKHCYDAYTNVKEIKGET